eukprot:TRINITY_DN3623_c0_g1_i1.p1 TRINITY_DN3623_c0_g1~~TRINITY_DN3623_c0_g1_i1.p1  ORF type:complete len:335 (+),score=138.22 TRINITY_DN3623_c0_g1_i1:49-1005(+)
MASSSSSRSVLYVALLIGFWYASSIINNVYTRRMMHEGFMFPFISAWLGMAAQLVALIVICMVKGVSPNPYAASNEDSANVAQLFPLSVCQISASLFHKFALLHATIPVVHTVKSLTTVGTALLSFSVTGKMWPSTPAVLLVVSGVCYAMLSGVDMDPESSFFDAAPALVCVGADSVRAVYGKQALTSNPMASLISLQSLSLVVFLPLVLAMEGEQFSDYLVDVSEGTEVTPVDLVVLSVLGVAGMELASSFTLSQLTPLTYAMANGLRSLVMVAAGALFGASISLDFMVGSSMSCAGMLLHSYAGQQQREAAKKKTE